MRKTVCFVIGGLAVASCTHQPEDVVVGEVTSTNYGEEAYLEHCAGCHETGMLGAPREGEPDDWEGRSSLWQAVLMEHAKTGYFDMPARGGKTRLPDEVVEAAAEYMLEQTFPDRPID